MINVSYNDGVTSWSTQLWRLQSRKAASKEVYLQAAAEDRR